MAAPEETGPPTDRVQRSPRRPYPDPPVKDWVISLIRGGTTYSGWYMKHRYMGTYPVASPNRGQNSTSTHPLHIWVGGGVCCLIFQIFPTQPRLEVLGLHVHVPPDLFLLSWRTAASTSASFGNQSSILNGAVWVGNGRPGGDRSSH